MSEIRDELQLQDAISQSGSESGESRLLAD
jgi:hypothetical protein